MIDRLVDYAEIFSLNGDSYWLRDKVLCCSPLAERACSGRRFTALAPSRAAVRLSVLRSGAVRCRCSFSAGGSSRLAGALLSVLTSFQPAEVAQFSTGFDRRFRAEPETGSRGRALRGRLPWWAARCSQTRPGRPWTVTSRDGTRVRAWSSSRRCAAFGVPHPVLDSRRPPSPRHVDDRTVDTLAISPATRQSQPKGLVHATVCTPGKVRRGRHFRHEVGGPRQRRDLVGHLGGDPAQPRSVSRWSISSAST